MDKTEYRMKLDEINRLVEAQDYEGALTIADSIDWRRVKSVRTLCMVADIYEVNGELEESMRMLQLAYKRSSVGKMILYRQVELSLKMGEYDKAVDYYNHYLETAANDTSKYILKYKIYKAQNAPLDDQIAILEEYKDREYTERWVYELARLYKKAGRQNKCVETCDDLILWFGEGKYVKKAMELKMGYEPLSPEQKAKYESWGADKKVSGESERKKVTAATVAGISAAAMESLQKASVLSNDDSKSSEKIAGMEKAAATETPKVSEEQSRPRVAEPEIHVDTAQLQERLAKSFEEVLSGFNRTRVVNAFEALGRATGSEPVAETEEENIEDYHVTELEPETVNEAVISADQGISGAHMTVEPEIVEETPEKEEKSEDKEIISVQEMDLDELFAETSSALAAAAGGNAEEAEVEAEEVEASEIEAEEVETSEIEAEPEEESVMKEAERDAVETAAPEQETVELEQKAENISEEAVELEENMEMDIPEITIIDPEEALKIQEQESEEPKEQEKPEDEAAEAAMAAFEASLLESLDVEDIPEPEPVSEEKAAYDVEDLDAVSEMISVGDTQEINLEEQLLAVMEEQENSEDGRKSEEEHKMPENLEDFHEELTEKDSENVTEESGEDFMPEIDLDLVLEVQKEQNEQKDQIDPIEAIEEISLEEEAAEEETEEETEEEVDHIQIMLDEAETVPDQTMVMPKIETPEEKRMRILNDTRPEKLTEHQKNLFSYFAKIPGMDEQILDAIHGVYEHAGEKTSRRGNIAIMGSHGTGKTRLSEGLVKAICKELGLEAAKYANLDASDMNRKDPAAVISKMSGGFLLIERASFMTPETIEKLSQAMDFRTDSMILIIEDDKANMRKLLADYPEFAKKFATVISIPVFTNDELVTFARTYARENGYRMDEMGVLALYTLIGDNQREDEPITIGKVKDMVDGAIRKASGVRLGRKISKRHTDEDGRILLYEKDFDI